MTWEPTYEVYEKELDGQRAMMWVDLAAIRHVGHAALPVLVLVRAALHRPSSDGVRTESSRGLSAPFS